MTQNLTTLKLTLISLSILLTTVTVLSTPVHGAVTLANAGSAPDATLPRFSGRPGWNPLWGIGPVIPPAGALDNVPVTNSDPATDTDTDTDTNTDLDTANNLNAASDNADANEDGANTVN